MAAKPLTFVVSSATRTVEDFETLAQHAARLRPHGEVQVNIASIVGPTRSDVPPGGSPWHDYTSWLGALEKFFPRPDLLPFIDQEHVRRNQQLLRGKVALLRKYALAATAGLHMPFFLPEEFFAEYPHLRGPRIDHPRRTRREAFAMCVDLPEARQFYARMFGEFAREVGELRSVRISTNDAGGGLCWADWLYNGPNGPTHCRGRDMGQRVRDFVNALRSAAPGRDIDFSVRGNFSDVELHAMRHHWDEHFQTRAQHAQQENDINIPVHVDNPVLGIMNPAGILKALSRLHQPRVKRVIMDFGSNYSRGHQQYEVIAKVLEIVDAYCAQQPRTLRAGQEFLWKLCGSWVGEGQADALYQAFYDLQEAHAYRAASVPLFTANYVGVSMRHINRPLVAVPEKLLPEEEAYWLPHVFNPSLHEARVDYIDWHGGRLSGPTEIDQGNSPRILAIDRFVEKLNKVAGQLVTLEGDGAEVFRKMGISLRIYASIMRSTNNFYSVQKLRDRNLERLAGEPRTPPKDANWVGEADLQMFNEFMRDELDNTTELLRILESGGTSQVLTAKDAAEEDTFLLGPGLVDQLRQKRQIMLRHWRDVELYLSTPHK